MVKLHDVHDSTEPPAACDTFDKSQSHENGLP